MEPQKLTHKLTLFGGRNDQPGEANANHSRDTERDSQKQGDLLPVAVRDLVPLLVDAFQTDRTWLKDFGREHIHVSSDLYDVLLAYQQYRRYDAA